MLKKFVYSVGLFALPILAFAQPLHDTRNIIISAGGIINLLIGLASALALLAFFWGLVKYIANAEDEGAKADGRRLMINGAIALFVLFSIFGIIRWLRGEFLLPNTNDLRAPGVTFPQAPGGGTSI